MYTYVTTNGCESATLTKFGTILLAAIEMCAYRFYLENSTPNNVHERAVSTEHTCLEIAIFNTRDAFRNLNIIKVIM